MLTAAAATLLIPSMVRAGAAVALGLRVHDHGTHTRLVMELSDPVDYSLFSLADPYRVVIDLPELEWTFGAQAEGVQTGTISALRYGLFQAGRSRIVLDLAVPSEVIRAFVLPATGATPHRFVLDLKATTRESFMAKVGPDKRMGGLSQQAQAPPPAVATEQPKGANRKKVVAIDPGHGGIDPGAIGISGAYEKNITLAAAQQLKAKLEATGRYRAVLTRTRDVSLGLRQRIEIARHAPADLFISLHADSMKDKSVRGLSVYTLSEKASDTEAASLAEAENKSDLIIGMDLTNESQEVRNILIDLARRESLNLGTRLATSLIAELQRETKLLHNGHRFAGFVVLKAPDIPSVLVEMGYMSNREEEAALRKEAYRAKLMTAVVKGVDQYFGALQSAQRT